MASGGGKIKSTGGHSPTKPYEQRKSFFQRVTDSIKDVFRPSWMGAEPPDESDASPPRTVEKSATFQEQEVTWKKEPLSERSSLSSENVSSSSPQQADRSVVLGNTTDPWSASSGNSSGLWSVSPGVTSGQFRQTAASSEGLLRQMESSSSVLGKSGPLSHGYSSSSQRQYDFSQLRRPALHNNVPSPRPHTAQSSLSYARQRQLRHQSDHQGSNTNSMSTGGREPEAGAAADVPSKRQRVWTPETSRKGRSLQPAVHGQPTFKTLVFCSSSMVDSKSESPSYPGKMNYGGPSSYRKQSLKSSSLYVQNSPPVRKSVTPKPMNRSGSAVLSSSTTQIFKTLERLSDAKRAKVELRDSDSFLSFSPSSSYWRTPRPLQRSFQSESFETRSPAKTSEANSHETVSVTPTTSRIPEPSVSRVPESTASWISKSTEAQAPQSTASWIPKSTEAQAPQSTASLIPKSTEAQAPESTVSQVLESAVSQVSEHTASNSCTVSRGAVSASPAAVSWGVASINSVVSRVPVSSALPHKAEVEVIISDDSSDNEDVQIIESPAEATGRGKGPGRSGDAALTVPQPKTKDFELGHPGMVAQGPCVSKAGSALTAGLGGSPSMSPYNSPSAWGSTAPKPKSIIAGSGKTSASNGKSVSFCNSICEEPSGSMTSPTQLKSGSVMDALRKSPEVPSSSPLPKSPAGQLKPGSVQRSSASSHESLSAVFAPPAGSWECEVCMVRNTPDLSCCLACQANRPGAAHKAAANSPASACSSSESLSAMFAPSAGSWECEVCMVRNTPDLSCCLACQANKPGAAHKGATPAATSSSPNSTPLSVAAGSSGGMFTSGTFTSTPTTTSPFLPPPSANKGAFGGVQLGSSTSKASVLTSAGFKPPSAAGTGGCQLGTSSTTSPSFPATGGFKLGTSASESVSSSSSPSGFTFGKPASFNNVPASSGLGFGGKGLSDIQSAKDPVVMSVPSTKSDTSSSGAGGFQFGMSAASSSTAYLFGGQSATASDPSESARTVFGIPNHCEKNNSNVQNDGVDLTSVEASDRSKPTSCTKGSPIASANASNDGVSTGAVQSLPTATANTGCFNSAGTTNGEQSAPFLLGSANVPSKVTLNGSDSCVKQSSQLETSTANSGFRFGGANKLEQSASSNQNGPNLFGSSSARGKGFVFGSSSQPTNTSGVSGAMSNTGSSGKESSPSPAKSAAINGEAGAAEKCAFGGESVAASSAPVGFSFSSPFLASKKATDGLKSVAQAKQPSSLGAVSGSEGTACDKDHTDNGTLAEDEAESFTFANSNTATAFKFGQPPGRGPSDFGFNAQSQANAASSKDLPSAQTALFGAGRGSTSTGQFPFSVGAGSQSNAAAASPLASDGSAAPPAKGFSFSGATQSSFKFGSGSSSNASTPAFQFASPQSVDPDPAPNPSSSFSFGKAAPSAASKSDAAPSPVSFGAAPVPNSCTVGAGEGPRKLKRATRRVPKN
ncbi:hypothetical protein ACOMHN_043990 [Nucella lapillus]